MQYIKNIFKSLIRKINKGNNIFKCKIVVLEAVSLWPKVEYKDCKVYNKRNNFLSASNDPVWIGLFSNILAS